jgi:hypothetical protein
LNALLSSVNIPTTIKLVNQQQPSYFILANNIAEDQSTVITCSSEIYFGIKGSILVQGQVMKTLQSFPTIPPILFVADDILKKKIVEAITFISSSKYRFNLIHENDGRRRPVEMTVEQAFMISVKTFYIWLTLVYTYFFVIAVNLKSHTKPTT